MAENVWIYPAATIAAPKNITVTRCAICGRDANGRGVIVELFSNHNVPLRRAICEADNAHHGAVADVIRTMKQPHLRAS